MREKRRRKRAGGVVYRKGEECFTEEKCRGVRRASCLRGNPSCVKRPLDRSFSFALDECTKYRRRATEAPIDDK